MKRRNCSIHVAKTKALICCAVTAADLRLCFAVGKNLVFSSYKMLKGNPGQREKLLLKWIKTLNQRTNGPINAHLRSGICDLS